MLTYSLLIIRLLLLQFGLCPPKKLNFGNVSSLVMWEILGTNISLGQMRKLAEIDVYVERLIERHIEKENELKGHNFYRFSDQSQSEYFKVS